MKKEKETKSSEPDEATSVVGEVLPERGHWGGRFDFILACLGTAVGLGNIWRFPYLCYRNGGGAFLIPYILMVFVVGLPVFLVELTLGQYGAMGPLKVFQNALPLFKGLGYAMVLAATLVAIYYNMIIGWTLFYLFDSFRSEVQWQYCHHDFNTNNCFRDADFYSCKALNESNVFFNRTCYNETFATANAIHDINETDRVAPPEEYLNRYVLDKSDGFEDMGNIRWQLLVCLAAAWIIVVICLIKGIKTSGKVVYFTATFPYVILIILFFRGVTLDGAADGLWFYIKPNFAKLSDIKVWEDAAIQVFYSFSIAGGAMITYASYNRFHNNLVKDVLIIGIGDMLTSIFGGVVVFSMIGFMAKQLGKPVDTVVKAGMGLAFIAYPDCITRMPLSILWSILFFFMLFLLGIDSQFAMVETVITFVFDQFPKSRARKPLVAIFIGTLLFILGLPLTTRGGIYLFDVMDTYAAGWPYLVIGLTECLVVSYIYGAGRFMQDLKEMTGWDPRLWIRSHLLVLIMTIAPLVILGILLMTWIQHKPLKSGSYTFPIWGNAIGWIMATIPVSFIPLGALHEICTRKETSLWSRIKAATYVTSEWRENARKNGKNYLEPFESKGYDNPTLAADMPPQYDSKL